jgi:CubicO group peptidase (beta-lactamase class C family)
MNLSLLKSALFILVLSIFWTGCEKDPITDIISNSPTFDIDQFEENIIDALDGNATGFAYTIAQNGQLYSNGAGGWAVVGANGANPGIPQSPDKRMTIASISKTITAVAALRVMEEHNVQLSEPFVNYLPSTWTVDPSLNDVSLEQLLTHTSGIVNGEAPMKSYVTSLPMVCWRKIRETMTITTPTLPCSASFCLILWFLIR